MTAKLTLEFDDETQPGFEQLVQNFEMAAQGSAQFGGQVNQNSAALAQLVQAQEQTAAAIQQHTIASLEAARRGFIATTNAVFEFGRNMAAAGGAVIEFAGDVKEAAEDMIKKRGIWFAVQSLGAAFLKIGPQVLGANVALGAFSIVAANTGERVVAVTDEISEQHRRLAEQITREQKTIQEVLEQTGAESLEELGLRAETNASRMGAAFSEMTGSVLSDVGLITKEFAKQQFPLTIKTWQAATENIDKRFTQFAQNAEENSELIRVGMDKILGRSTELRREQEKLAEEAERTAPIRKRAREFEKTLKQEMQLTRELNEIKRLETQEEVEQRITAERKKREEMIQSATFRGQAEEALNKRLRALMQQEETLRQQKLERQEEAVKRSAEQRKAIREQELQQIQEQAQKEAEILRKKEEKKQAILEEVEKGRRSLLEQRQDHFFESIKSRLEAEEGNADKILAIEKEAAKTKAQTQIAAAENAEEVVRIRFELERKLRDLDLQHKIETEQKKAEASERAKQKELEDERKKIQALKQMQNEQGQNVFQAIVSKQSREKVLQEVVRDRIKEADKEDPDLSERRQRRRNIQIRRQVMQQAQGGQLNPGEIAQAQGDLAARQILQARAQGKLSDQMVKAMAEQARAFAEQARTQEQLVEESREFQEFLRQQKQAARRRGQRLRNQRRGLRN